MGIEGRSEVCDIENEYEIRCNGST
jgi:hypothetical protein